VLAAHPSDIWTIGMMKIREATPKDCLAVARIQVDTWRSTYTGIISTQYLDQLSVPRSSQYWESAIIRAEPKKFLLIIENEGIPRGFLAGGPHRTSMDEYPGEVYALYVEKMYQRSSMGEAIFKAGLEKLKKLGMDGIAVWVLKDNPSFRFYEKMGGIILCEKETKIGEAFYAEVGYGWPKE
jgi:ribosomal protein S18 acetylase RimI-like enzyme